MIKSVNRKKLLGSISSCLFVFASTGCALVENPSVDELFGQSRVVTPSASAALAADVSMVPRQRAYAVTTRSPADGQVTHGALYFQDGFEETSMDDGRFCWSAEDQIAMPLGVARFLINIVTIPFSVLKAPPGTVIVSDGQSASPNRSERT